MPSQPLLVVVTFLLIGEAVRGQGVAEGAGMEPLTVEAWSLTADGESSIVLSGMIGGPSNDLGDREEFVSTVAELQKRAVVEHVIHFRSTVLPGMTAGMRLSERRPVVTNVALSNRGTSRSIEYQVVGTLLQATPKRVSDRAAQVEVAFETSSMADSELKVYESEDGSDVETAKLYKTLEVETEISVRLGRPAVIAERNRSAANESIAEVVVICVSGAPE